jgi:hypothetical protein
VTPGAVGVALAASTAGARAAVPAALAREAVAAATGGASTATITALTNTIIRSMLMSKLKIKYGADASEGFTYFGELFHDLTVTTGEFKDLGDIKPVPPKRDN